MGLTTTTSKRRVHQVAKEFNVSNEALIGYLSQLDFAVSSPMTALTDEMYEQVLKKYHKEPAKDANYEFRKQIREKKLEEERERVRARHDVEERLRVATKIMGDRAGRPTGRDAGKVDGKKKEAREDAAEIKARKPRAEELIEAKAVPEVKLVPEAKAPEAKQAPESKPPAEAKHVPTLQESIVSLIPAEDLLTRPPTPPAAGKEVAPVVAAPKPATTAEKSEATTETTKKRKRRRRRKRKPTATEVAAAEGLDGALVERLREKIKPPAEEAATKQRGGGAAKRKKRKKRKISEEEIEESIRQTLAAMDGPGKPRRRRRVRGEDGELAIEEKSRISVPEFTSVSDLAKIMEVEPSEVIRKCLDLGLIVSINQRLDTDTIEMVADEFEYEIEIAHEYDTETFEEEPDEDEQELRQRPPVVTIMGHVDHGKTSLLDFIRRSNITAGEAGGITQHIGAYEVEFADRQITFLDTPGHEAFTAMRARGAQATDIVILVVASDDGVQQQTIEAISHARAAGVPMVVAINKIDKPSANPDGIKQQLAQHGVLVESWGGKVQSAEISAKTGVGIDHLLELVLLESDILDLKANHERRAKGVVVEAELDKGKGPVATVLVQSGTMAVGDPFIAGLYHGKVRAMYDEHGHRVQNAPPSRPVRVVGFTGVPSAGDSFMVLASETETKEISSKRQQLRRAQDYRRTPHITLDQLSKRIKEGEVKELYLIVKADFDGSVEALSDALLKLSTGEVAVNVIHKGVGGISESDVLLAAASDAIVFGFNVRATQQAREIAEREKVDLRLYKIIYDAVNDVKAALEGLLEPEISEQITSSVVVRDTFKIPKIGTIAGCYVQTGKVNRNDNLRLYRHDKLIHEGKLDSLKRFKDDVREVASGFECGIAIENYDDIHVEDVIETYQIIKTKRTLAASQ